MDKIKEPKIIDFLYGNLSEEEQDEMKNALQNDKYFKAEIDAMVELQSVISGVEDKEVIPPSFVFDIEQDNEELVYKSPFFKKTLTIAAGFALIIFSTYLTGFQMNYSNSGFDIGFNSKNINSEKGEIRAMMKEVLAENSIQTDQKIIDIEEKFTNQINANNKMNVDSMQKMLLANSGESKSIMEAYVKQLNKENLGIIQNFFTVSNSQQQKYLNDVLADFNTFYQTQRDDDLKMIETGLNTIQNENVVKQYETDVVLANLMDIVKVKNK